MSALVKKNLAKKEILNESRFKDLFENRNFENILVIPIKNCS